MGSVYELTRAAHVIEFCGHTKLEKGRGISDCTCHTTKLYPGGSMDTREDILARVVNRTAFALKAYLNFPHAICT